MRILSRLTLFLLLLTGAPAFAQEHPPIPDQWDPYRAEKNLEIGRFYLKKGNYDAAIERFLDAIRYRSNFAVPHKLLGEAYEKKAEKTEAVKYYRKYLEILPQADDAGKIKKKIEDLDRQIEKERARKKRVR